MTHTQAHIDRDLMTDNYMANYVEISLKAGQATRRYVCVRVSLRKGGLIVWLR